MLNHLIKSERAARDAFLADDYFGAATDDTDKVDGLVNTFTFLLMSVALCSAAIVVVILLV